MKLNIIIRKFKSSFSIFKKNGIDGFFYALFRNIGFKIKYNSFIDKKKDLIKNKVIIITNKIIISGLYKSTNLSCNSHWGNGYDISAKLLGFYEQQVQEKIVNLKKNFNLENIINFGAADGFHIVGLIKNGFFNKGAAFEISAKGREFLQENIDKNNLAKKIQVFEEANFMKATKYFNNDHLNKTLYLVDIEGEEFSLFDKSNLNYFKNSILIIENHDFMVEDKELVKKFFNLINENFNIEILLNSGRNPFLIKEIENFNDDEKWLIMGEGRPKTMEWLVCVPKNYK
jgi:hypothetical protein